MKIAAPGRPSTGAWLARGICAAILTGALAATAKAEERIPLETFFRMPRFAQMRLSPDGKSLAALSPVSGRQNIVIVDHGTREAHPVTALAGRDVVWFDWVNDNRLVYRTGSLAERDADARGGGLFAVDRDGSAHRQLSEGIDETRGGAIRFVYRPVTIIGKLADGGDEVVAQETRVEHNRVSSGPVFRLNTRTGRRTPIVTDAPTGGESERWVVDGSGVPRALTVLAQNAYSIHYRPSANEAWTKLDEFPADSPGWRPLAIAEDGRSLIATSQKGRDRAAIVRFDPQTRAVAEVLAEHPQVDLRELIRDGERVVGVRFDADREGTAWFDAGLARIQKSVDAAFPDSVNQLSWSRNREQVLIYRRSDIFPGSFHLLDTKAGKMEWLADRAPWIRPEAMAPTRAVRYPARDGLEIPAYLTLPRGAGAKPLPLIVLVHGGPWVDGARWRFDPEVQFLVSRGYAVLQPNFRGTTRYGWKHFASSFGQWGLAMQDDLEDGVRWSVASGVADPKRVCIAGASYGGYAAMMGLAKTPELYRCGINWIGVTDLNLLLTAAWSDTAYSDFMRFRAQDMIGDPDRDRERFRNTSPVEQAARIRAPVFMAYGSADRRVPLEHGDRMKAALDKAGTPVEWMVFEGEGHGFRRPENVKRFHGAMERFLDRHIGDAAR